MMDPAVLVQTAIKGMMKNKYEILPGMARMLKVMSRIAPKLVFNQMAKIAEKSLAGNPSTFESRHPFLTSGEGTA